MTVRTYHRLDRVKENRYAVTRVTIENGKKSMKIIDYLIKVRVEPTNEPYFNSKDRYVQWQLKNRNRIPNPKQYHKQGLLTWGLERGKTAHLTRKKAFDYACVS